MGSYNYLAADAECSKCGCTSYFPEIQFKYGLCRTVKYLIGFEIEHDLTPVGAAKATVPGRTTVGGLGCCPNCNQIADFELEIVDSVIIDVRSVRSMKSKLFSILATVMLVPVGGRNGPIKSGYKCPMLIGDEYWDCYVTFEGDMIFPGESRSGVNIQFLSPEAVSERLTENSVFYLTEGKVVASGTVDVCYRISSQS